MRSLSELSESQISALKLLKDKWSDAKVEKENKDEILTPKQLLHLEFFKHQRQQGKYSEFHLLNETEKGVNNVSVD